MEGGSGSKLSSLRFVLGTQEPQKAISRGRALVCQESEKRRRPGGWFRGEESPAEKLGRLGAEGVRLGTGVPCEGSWGFGGIEVGSGPALGAGRWWGFSELGDWGEEPVLNANGLRYVQVTAAVVGAHDVSLGDVCVWWLKSQSGRDHMWKEVPVGDLPSGALIEGQWGCPWDGNPAGSRAGCGEARDLKGILRDMSGGSW